MSVHSAASSTTLGASSQTAPTRGIGFSGFVAALLKEFRIRQALRQAASLDDSMLHDMGISPGGIEDAVRSGRR